MTSSSSSDWPSRTFGGDTRAVSSTSRRCRFRRAGKPSRAAFEALAQSFKELPPPRQQAIRELDQAVHAAEIDARQLFARSRLTASGSISSPSPNERSVLAAHAQPPTRRHP